jgi:hypothetical protein
MDHSVEPSLVGPLQAHSGGRERGITPIVFILVALVFVLVSAGAGAYVFLRSADHPSEETAQFLPANTDVYYSFNMRPGAGQLLQVRRIINRYTDNPDFQDKVDDLVNSVEDETSIHLLDDVLPWLGPELAVGVINVGDAENDPQVVAFLGTGDSDAAERVLRRFIDYLEDQDRAEFRRNIYEGFTTYREVSGAEEMHFAVTDRYLVTASKERLLEDTLDMMVKSEDALSDKEEFKDAQESVRGRRFSILYVDVDSIMAQLMRQGDTAEAMDASVLRELRDRLPAILGVSSSFVDKGLRIDGFYSTPPGSDIYPPANALGSADLLPEGSPALLSLTGLQETWTGLEEALDLRSTALGFELASGIDIDRDILGWMTGEVAIALLPNNFSSDLFGDLQNAVHALAFFEYTDYRDAEDALGSIVDALEDLGVPFDDVEIEGDEATMVDLRGFLGETDYRPGFMLLDDFVVLGTTKEALRTALEVRNGDEDSLSSESEFRRVTDMAPAGKNALFFLNIKEARDAFVASLDPAERDQFREDIAPYVEPLRASLVGAETNEQTTTFTIVLTIE